MRRPLQRARILRRTDDQPTLPAKVKRILRKYGATLLMPGPSGILQYGFQPGNYKESTGQTLAAVDQQVGLVVDAAGSVGNNLVNPANWLSGAGTVIAGGVATATAVVAGLNIVQQDNIGLAGKMLEITAAVTVVSGGVAFRPGAVSGPTITASGTYTHRIKAGDVDAFRIIAGASGFTGSIDLSTVSVRELPGIHASQATSGFQPYLRQSGGVNSWQFDGTDDRLSLSAVPFQMSDDHFVVAGATFSSGGVSRCLFGQGTGSALSSQPFFGINATGYPSVYVRRDDGAASSANGTNQIAYGEPVVLSYTRTGSGIKTRQNSVQVGATTSVFTSTATVSGIGANMRATPSEFHNGHTHCVILGKGTITEAELLTLEKFIAKLQGRSL